MINLEALNKAKELIDDSNKDKISEGLKILESFDISKADNDLKIQILYYEAIAQTKLKKLKEASSNLQKIIQLQPDNHKAQDLLRTVNNLINGKEDNNLVGVVGVVVGTVGTILGAIALGLFLNKK
ncbi:unnamed protein product [Brachionus calyciflorus]|uniref:Mitochondrial fission 1 protein n=1 Tax=Brachionus calyciflorus TaxID=104777 RepID=A0A814I4C2_9BILA|nr:unnamed protein product [Brachionus calyciflorus]